MNGTVTSKSESFNAGTHTFYFGIDVGTDAKPLVNAPHTINGVPAFATASKGSVLTLEATPSAERRDSNASDLATLKALNPGQSAEIA